MKKPLLCALGVCLFLSSCIKDYIGHPNGPDEPHVDTSTLSFERLGTFSNGSGDEGFAEISAFDAKTKKLFIVNPKQTEVSVWDISSPSAAVKLSSIALSGTPNSVGVNDGLLAVAVENTDKQANGTIETFDTETLALQKSYLAGALPDMVTFSPNGRFIIAANEGEPNADYTVDPEGSVSVVDIAKNEINTLYFGNFDTANIGKEFRVFGPSTTFSQDVEPEYVAVSDDSKYAYVTLQENNGIAVIDLTQMAVTQIYGLGAKDYSLPENTMDASDKDGIIGNFQNWPVYGLYQPDAIAFAKIQGTGYLVTANEGDSRDYDGYSEEERVKDLVLDATVFPNAAELQLDENLGRLKTTTANGDTDGDGDFDRIYTYGGRSFSIWDAYGSLIYDSADDIGRRTLEIYPSLFNGDNGEADGRSDDKGAEPESVATLTIGESVLLFVGLERTGGAMVYDITNPYSPEFVDWILNTEDVAPEGLLVIQAEDSPTEKNLLVITNEVSNTISIYEIR